MHGDSLERLGDRVYTDYAREIFPNNCDPTTIGPNAVTLGIEMCVSDWTGEFSQATLGAAADLAQAILARYIRSAEKVYAVAF